MRYFIRETLDQYLTTATTLSLVLHNFNATKMVLQGKKSSNFIKRTKDNFGCLHCYKAQEEKNQI